MDPSRPPASSRIVPVLLALALAVGACVAGTRARAAAIEVTTTEDELDTDGDCSLREALRASTTNAAVDACPAGDGGLDTITLLGGAVYALTRPDVGGDDAAGGDLDAFGDARTGRVRIEAVGAAPAVIRQQVPRGGSVLSIDGIAVELRRLVIEGGRSKGLGGGVQVVSGDLVAEECRFVDNQAVKGGAIAVLAGQASIADGEFHSNVARRLGGAIYTRARTYVARTRFVDNLAGNGGAVFTEAIQHGWLGVGESCLVGNDDVAISNVKPRHQSATGNWWGAADGPSGVAAGSGDSVSAFVDVAGALPAPPDACLPMTLIANGGFERAAEDGDDRAAQGWTTSGLESAADGRSCDASGACDFVLTGGGATGRVAQTIRLAGRAGDRLRLIATAAATAAASPGAPRVRATLFHTDGSILRRTLRFPSGTYGAERRSAGLRPKKSWDRVEVELLHAGATGLVRFDDLELRLQR